MIISTDDTGVPASEDAGFNSSPATGAGATTATAPLIEAQIESQQAAQNAGALTLAALFGDKTVRHSLGLFKDDTAALAAVEAALFVKGGKPYVKCLATDKDRPAKPEELVRQLWIHRLLHHYGYPKKRIGIEFPITFGRDTSNRADIVIFDADRVNAPYIILKSKPPNSKTAKTSFARIAMALVRRLACGRMVGRFRSTTGAIPITLASCPIFPVPAKTSKQLSTSLGQSTR